MAEENIQDQLKEIISRLEALENNDIVATDEKKIKRILENVTKKESDINSKYENINKINNEITTAKTTVDDIVAEINKNKPDMEAVVTTIKGVLNTANQEKTNLDATISKINQTCQNIEDANTKCQNLKKDIEDYFENAKSNLGKLKSDFEEMHTQKSQSIDTMNTDWGEKFEKLHQETQEEINRFFAEIEKLLSGATSVALAGAFTDRKNEIQKNKKWWGTLLVLSASAIVAFGFCSLYQPSDATFANSALGRFAVIGGLVAIEEFARRNFNIISRLAEAYAYKAVISKSYQGYKKELGEIMLSGTNSSEKVSGNSKLAKIFLDKLEDEPGKSVFDKEKQIDPNTILKNTSLEATEEKNDNTPPTIPKMLQEIPKIQWPGVVAIAILAIAACVIVYLCNGLPK